MKKMACFWMKNRRCRNGKGEWTTFGEKIDLESGAREEKKEGKIGFISYSKEDNTI